MVVNLDVTNNSEEYLNSYSPAYNLQAMVDGEVLEYAYVDESNPYYEKESKIKSGESGIVQAAFSLQDIDYDDDSVIDFVLTSYNLEDYSEVTIIEDSVNIADLETMTSESEFD